MGKRSPNELAKRRVPATAARSSASAVAREVRSADDTVVLSPDDSVVLSPDDSVVLSPDDSVLRHPHQFEQEVRFRLMAEPTLNFSSLTVRRIPDGVCVEGVVETDDDLPDISRLVRRITGVEKVLNYLVVRRPYAIPPKG